MALLKLREIFRKVLEILTEHILEGLQKLTPIGEDLVLHEVLEDNPHPLLKEVVLHDVYDQRL